MINHVSFGVRRFFSFGVLLVVCVVDLSGDTPVAYDYRATDSLIALVASGDADPLEGYLHSRRDLPAMMRNRSDALWENDPIHAAIRFHQHAILDIMLQSGFPVEYRNGFGLRPLQVASLYGDLPAVQLLLRYGAKVNPSHYRSPEFQDPVLSEILPCAGLSPLHLAVLSGKHDLVLLLLEHGARLQEADRICGYTPLSIAALRGDTTLVKILLGRGASVFGRVIGTTPIHLAAEGGDLVMVRLLARYGASLRTKDKFARNLLHKACEAGSLDLVGYLLQEGLNINDRDLLGRTPMHWGARRGDVGTMEYLRANGASCVAVDYSGATPLSLAAHFDHLPAVRWLVDHGAGVDRDREGLSPADWGAIEGHGGITAYFASLGEFYDTSLVVDGGRFGTHPYLFFTPDTSYMGTLQRLAWRGDQASVGDLLAHTNLREADRQSNPSTLHMAAWGGDRSTLLYLLDQYFSTGPWDENASVYDKGNLLDDLDDDSFAPLHYAIVGGHRTAARILLLAGAPLHTWEVGSLGDGSLESVEFYHQMIRYGEIDAVHALIDLGSDPKRLAWGNDWGRPTPIEAALESGHRTMIETITRLGGGKSWSEDLDWRRTPLHRAAMSGRLAPVRWVFDHLRVEVNAREDYNGDTPLHLCLRCEVDPEPELIEYLIGHGANLRLTNNDGETPIAYYQGCLGRSQRILDILLGAASNGMN